MVPLVRDLYKRFLLAGRAYPSGLPYVRERVKAGFHENAGMTLDLDIKRAVGKGRYLVRELNAISRLHKYRALCKNYENTT